MKKVLGLAAKVLLAYLLLWVCGVLPLPHDWRAATVFEEAVASGDIVRVTVNGRTIIGVTQSGERMTARYNIINKNLLEDVELSTVPSSPWQVEFLGIIGTIIVLVLVSLIVTFSSAVSIAARNSKQKAGAPPNNSTAKATSLEDALRGMGAGFGRPDDGGNHQVQHSGDIPKENIDDIRGIDEIMDDIKATIEVLKNREVVAEIGGEAPKGMILYGPPGTGKTMIARAIAGACNMNFIQASGSSFVELYVGNGSKKVRALFNDARKLAPCIVFIDEIDAVGKARGGSNSNDEREQTLNQLLVEMDGYSPASGVFVIAATNRLDVLDPALLRPGRFNRQIAIPLPDKKGREDIFDLYARRLRLDSDVNLKNLVAKTSGFSGADIKNLLNEAALLAVQRGLKIVSAIELDDAFFKILMKGNKRKSERIEEEQRIIAWHEAGHALIAKKLLGQEVPQVTIIGSTSGAGGVTFLSPEEKLLRSKKELRQQVMISYGGRAAEEVLLKDPDEITTGASSDISNASVLIKMYLEKYGMGDYGMLDCSVFTVESTEHTIKMAANLSKQIYGEALSFLKDNESDLGLVANALLEKETLYDSDLNELLCLKA